MKKLIVNADDFGYNSKINQGIVHSHKNGVVTSTSMLVTKEGFEDAVTLAKDNPKLSIGLHLDLDEFFEIDHTRGKIVGINQDKFNINEIEQEIKRQIESLLSHNISPDHLTGHHHVHLVKEIFYIIVPIMKQYNIKSLRFNRKILYDQNLFSEFKQYLDDNNLIYPPHFIEGWYWGNIDEPYTVAELMTHPGYGELWREYELLASCDTRLKTYLREKNIQLITWTEFINETSLKSN